MWWPQRALFGCAALKSAHASSRQTVSAEVAENKSKSGLVRVFLDRSAVEVHAERARVVRLEPDQLVGLVVELAEQNAIDLVRAPLVSSHTCKKMIRGIAAEARRRHASEPRLGMCGLARQKRKKSTIRPPSVPQKHHPSSILC